MFAHRHVTVAGDTNLDIVGLNEDLWKTAFLRNPKEVERPKNGDYKAGEIIAEMTLECLHGDGGFLGKAHY